MWDFVLHFQEFLAMNNILYKKSGQVLSSCTLEVK